MTEKVLIHWDRKNEKWKGYILDANSEGGYDKHLVHYYDEPPCIFRLAFAAHFNEIMGLLYMEHTSPPNHRRSLHNIVMKSMKECCHELQAKFDDEQARQLRHDDEAKGWAHEPTSSDTVTE